jgi:hypothetical protein
MTKDDFLKQQAELDKEMKKIWGNPSLDGITCYEEYQKTPIKILWILKEPHGDSEKNTYRDFLSNPKNYYPHWMQTQGNIMRVSYAILVNADEKAVIIDDFNKIPKINTDDCEIEPGNNILEAIAVINLKKKPGGKRTDHRVLEREYRRDGVRDFLLKQIEFINPKVIINCHRVMDFINDQLGGNVLNKINGEGYGFNDGRLIINTGHPNVHGTTTNENYCNNILNIVNDKILGLLT